MVKQTNFGFGVDAQAGPGGLSSPDSPLPSGPLLMTFVMGGNSRAGSRQTLQSTNNNLRKTLKGLQSFIVTKVTPMKF